MFLQASTTVIPTFDHDYPQWHKGREQYSLWYLEIQDAELLVYLNQLRDAFSDILYQPNTRQFHISLYICGFKTQHAKKWDDDFDCVDLNTQIDVLNQLKLNAFKLTTAKLNSFHSALFLEIQDPSGSLALIRKQLTKTSGEIAALEYCPHITIGLYRSAMSSDAVFDRIRAFEQRFFEFSQTQLIYGTYQSQLLQGTLQTYTRIQLGE